MAEKKPVDLSFPVKGYDEGWAYKSQPEGTSPKCVNVRAYDVLGERLRGGQRAGLTKYLVTQVNGDNPVQLLYQEPIAASGFTDSFPYTDGTIFDSVGNPWRHYQFQTTDSWIDALAGGALPPLWISGHAYVAGDQVVHSATRYICKTANSDAAFTVAKWYVYTAATTPPKWITGHLFNVGDLVVELNVVYICINSHTSGTFTTDFANADWQILDVVDWIPGQSYKVGDQVLEAGVLKVCITANSDAVFTTGKWATYTALTNPVTILTNAYRITDTVPGTPTAHVAQFSTATGDMTVGLTVTKVGSVDGTEIVGLLFRMSSNAAQGYVLEYIPATTTGNPVITVYDQTGTPVYSGIVAGYSQSWTSSNSGAAPGQITADTPVRLVVTATGTNLSIYMNGVLVGSAPGVLTNTTGTYAGFAAFGNGDPGNIFDLSDFALAGVASALGGGERILACSAGTLYSGSGGGSWQLVAAGFIPTGIVRAQTAFSKVYLTDGVSAHYRIYDPGSRTVITWTPTANVLPVGKADPSLGATLIALYRGRIVLSGIADDPQNWFMSAAGDPLDWNYGATPSATMAVAGNNSVAGLVGDRITCLAPANDDLMVIGGDHTVWMMRGDPADGGRIDNISQQTGIAGPDAFAFDPQAVMYFFGNGILWRLTPKGELTPISRGRMDRTFGAIDLTTSTMRLLWDKVRHGLYLFVTPLVSGPSTSFFWDARTDSFWPEEYPYTHGPTAVLNFDANAPGDQALLLGGQDGYVRYVDPTAVTDDGTTIYSQVRFGPMTPGSVHLNSRLSRVITVLETSSDPASVRIYAAQSPEEVVVASAPAWSYSATAVDRYGVPRVSGNSLMFEIVNDSFSVAWATGMVYSIGDQVVAADGLPYVALMAHTSTTGGAHPSPTGGGNTTDWAWSNFRTWALESLNAIIETSGRTRHGRL